MLIVCFWLIEYLPKFNKLPSVKISSLVSIAEKYQKQALTIILCLNFIAGISIYFLDLTQPFSPNKNVADCIEKNDLESLTIVGSEDMWISPLSALLNKQIYYPEIGDFGTFTVLTSQSKRRIDNPKQQDIIQQVDWLIDKGEREILLILNQKLEKTTSKFKITSLTFFEDSMVPKQEQYYLYLVKKASE